MTDYQVSITRARLLRHAPTSRQGAEAAAVDIAQDLLLRHLHEIGFRTSRYATSTETQTRS